MSTPEREDSVAVTCDQHQPDISASTSTAGTSSPAKQYTELQPMSQKRQTFQHVELVVQQVASDADRPHNYRPRRLTGARSCSSPAKVKTKRRRGRPRLAKSIPLKKRPRPALSPTLSPSSPPDAGYVLPAHVLRAAGVSDVAADTNTSRRALRPRRAQADGSVCALAQLTKAEITSEPVSSDASLHPRQSTGTCDLQSVGVFSSEQRAAKRRCGRPRKHFTGAAPSIKRPRLKRHDSSRDVNKVIVKKRRGRPPLQLVPALNSFGHPSSAEDNEEWTAWCGPCQLAGTAIVAHCVSSRTIASGTLSVSGFLTCVGHQVFGVNVEKCARCAGSAWAPVSQHSSVKTESDTQPEHKQHKQTTEAASLSSAVATVDVPAAGNTSQHRAIHHMSSRDIQINVSCMSRQHGQQDRGANFTWISDVGTVNISRVCAATSARQSTRSLRPAEEEDDVGDSVCDGDSGMFPCPECDRRFNLESALKKHQKCHLGDGGSKMSSLMRRRAKVQERDGGGSYGRGDLGSSCESLTCATCGCVCADRSIYDTHVKLHTGERKWECRVCHRGFSKKLKLRKHMVVHSKAMLHKCRVCHREFRWKEKLMKHMMLHTGERPFRCNIDDCSKAFRAHSDLNIHLRNVHNVQPKKINYPIVKSEPKPNHCELLLMRVNEVSGVPSCDLCSHRFTSKLEYLDHVIPAHRDQEAFVCHPCKKVFGDSNVYEEHMQLRHRKGEVLWRCHLCPRVYSKQSFYEGHCRLHCTHFQCKICFRFSPEKRCLERHIQCHRNTDIDNDDHSCTICERTFKLRFSLKNHMYKAHSIDLPSLRKPPMRKFECSVCQARFIRPAPAFAHMVKVHNIRPDFDLQQQFLSVSSIPPSVQNCGVDEQHSKTGQNDDGAKMEAMAAQGMCDASVADGSKYLGGKAARRRQMAALAASKNHPDLLSAAMEAVHRADAPSSLLPPCSSAALPGIPALSSALSSSASLLDACVMSPSRFDTSAICDGQVSDYADGDAAVLRAQFSVPMSVVPESPAIDHRQLSVAMSEPRSSVSIAEQMGFSMCEPMALPLYEPLSVPISESVSVPETDSLSAPDLHLYAL